MAKSSQSESSGLLLLGRLTVVVKADMTENYLQPYFHAGHVFHRTPIMGKLHCVMVHILICEYLTSETGVQHGDPLGPYPCLNLIKAVRLLPARNLATDIACMELCLLRGG